MTQAHKGSKAEDGKGPAHYRQGGIEPIEFILSNKHLGWCESNIIKYVYRWRTSAGGLRDLEKAAEYLRILIEREEEKCLDTAASKT